MTFISELGGKIQKILPLIIKLKEATEKQLNAYDFKAFQKGYELEQGILKQIWFELSPLMDKAELIAKQKGRLHLFNSWCYLRPRIPSFATLVMVLLLFISSVNIDIANSSILMFKQEIIITTIDNSGQIKLEEKVITAENLKGIPAAPEGYVYWKTVKGEVTAYVPKRKSITSIGKNAFNEEGCAVDPKRVPYNAFVFIPGVGFRIADDTGPAIRKHPNIVVDVRMTRPVHMARKFGRKKGELHLYLPQQM